MGYPHTASTIPSQPSKVQETVTQVLSQVMDRLLDLEMKLGNIRDRIEPWQNTSIEKGLPTQPVPSSGTLRLSTELRNIASRLLDRCSEIDSLL